MRRLSPLISLGKRFTRALRMSELDPRDPTHSARVATRRLAVTLASLLSGVSAALIVPLLLPRAGWLVALLITSAAALWPILIDLVYAPSLRRPWSSFSGLLLSAPLAVLAHFFYHPSLRVLNLSGRPLNIAVDGRPEFTLPSTSLESPRAGAELRLPLGQHELSANDSQGNLLVRQRVRIVAGQTHLYAPLSTGSCFTLETSHYGREGVEISRAELPVDSDFWVLPSTIDLWLTPAPASGEGSRWSGGTLTALRHHPCRGPGSPAGP